MNVELLQQVKVKILEHAASFDMTTWFNTGSTDDPCEILKTRSLAQLQAEVESKCGTTACIGGWSLLLAGKSQPSYRLMNSATALVLDLDWDVETQRSEEAARLTLYYKWPKEFQVPYGSAKTSFERAQAACARIDHFILTNGAE